ncbi:MAG: hypothetical protein LW878_02055 [Proteobacteria bacterium]|jgi:hypothetical protein|nr:hypothetical protein [Pseudomonadota bacterium]
MRAFFILMILLTSLHSTSVVAKSYLIYSVAQDLPMGVDEQVLKKNFYVNMGSNQGVKKGTLLDVFRIISVLDPYDNRKRINYRVKIGELKVLHANQEAAITISHKTLTEDLPVLDLDSFIVGDHVAVATN